MLLVWYDVMWYGIGVCFNEAIAHWLRITSHFNGHRMSAVHKLRATQTRGGGQ